VEQRDIAKFQGSLIQIIETLLSGMNKERDGLKGLDDQFSKRLAAAPGIATVIELLQEALETSCRSPFRISNRSQKATSHISAPGGHKILQS